MQGNIFGSIDENILARAEALADISKASSPPHIKPDSMYSHSDMNHHHHQMGPPRPQMPLHGFGAPGESMLEQISAASMSMGMGGGMQDHSMGIPTHPHHGQPHHMYSAATSVYPHCGPPSNAAVAAAINPMQHHHPGLTPPHPGMQHPGMHDLECDPRELEAFAEHFKQRRIKLGVTQCDVGNALGKLKLPGVGSLSQSTICRFESLTLSHNNMIALKPVLHAWLEEAEAQAREAKNEYGPNGDKKRKRTSIAAPEKRSLEAFFAVQPRPSGEKIAQIAEKLDLKKNVVRVWFCNQRQKQKRMKFSTLNMQGMGCHPNNSIPHPMTPMTPHTPHPPH